MTWGLLTLGDSLELLIDNRGKNPPFEQSGIPLLSGKSITDRGIDMAKARFISDETYRRWMPQPIQRGDLILTSEAPLGRVARVRSDQQVALGQRIFGLRGRRGILDTGYLYYAFQSAPVAASLQALATGTTVQGIRQPALRSLKVPAPDYDSQCAIAEVLGALDDKIAANDRAADVVEELISVLYARAVCSVGTMARPLFEMLTIEFGEPFKGEMFSEPGAGRPLIRIRDLKTMRPHIWTTESRVREAVVEPGDVLVGMDAEFRAQWWLGEPGLLNQRVCRVRGDGLGNAFVAQSLVEPLARLENEKSATTVIHLNKSDLERSVILVPAAERLSEFERMAEPLLGVRVALAKENRQLAAARDELLPLLMSGRVRVKDAEKILEEVL